MAQIQTSEKSLTYTLESRKTALFVQDVFKGLIFSFFVLFSPQHILPFPLYLEDLHQGKSWLFGHSVRSENQWLLWFLSVFACVCLCVWSSLRVDAELSSDIWDSEVTTEGQRVQTEESEKSNGLRSLVRSLSFLGKMARNYKVGEEKQDVFSFCFIVHLEALVKRTGCICAHWIELPLLLE